MLRCMEPLCEWTIDCAGVRGPVAVVDTRSTLIATEPRGLGIDGEPREEIPEDTLVMDCARLGCSEGCCGWGYEGCCGWGYEGCCGWGYEGVGGGPGVGSVSMGWLKLILGGTVVI